MRLSTKTFFTSITSIDQSNSSAQVRPATDTNHIHEMEAIHAWTSSVDSCLMCRSKGSDVNSCWKANCYFFCLSNIVSESIFSHDSRFSHRNQRIPFYLWKRNCRKYYQIIMASESSVTDRTHDKRDSQKLFRHDRCSHYRTIGRSIENIIHRSENGQFKENCLRLLQIDSATNRKGTQSKKLTELLHENHAKNRRWNKIVVGVYSFIYIQFIVVLLNALNYSHFPKSRNKSFSASPHSPVSISAFAHNWALAVPCLPLIRKTCTTTWFGPQIPFSDRSQIPDQCRRTLACRPERDSATKINISIELLLNIFMDLCILLRVDSIAALRSKSIESYWNIVQLRTE